MKISDLEALGKPAQDYADGQVDAAYTGDLLSDVMAHAPDQSVLITIQGHKNTVAVASLVGIRAIVLANGVKPQDDMLVAARDEGVAVFLSAESQFALSGAIGKIMGR